MVPLSCILSDRTLDNEWVYFRATEDWAQGRTCFGGFLAALSVVSMRDTMAIDAPLRSIHTNFIAPVPPGVVACRSHLLRQGKSVAQVRCEIFSDETLCGSVIGVFGNPRKTTLPGRSPSYSKPSCPIEDCQELPFVPGVTPQFLQHISLRWAQGELPFTRSNDWSSRIYLKVLDECLSPEVQIVLLSDGPPSPALCFFGGQTMSSSVAWSLELPPLPAEQSIDGWFLIDTDVVVASEGYTHLSAKLWTPEGQLASLSNQVVAVFG